MVTVPVELAVGETVSWAGAKVQEAPAGRLAQASVTVPLKL
jgi:hypothetical protein